MLHDVGNNRDCDVDVDHHNNTKRDDFRSEMITGVLRAHNRKRVCRVFSLILMQSDTHISMTSHTAHTFSVFYKYAAGLSQLVVGQALNT